LSITCDYSHNQGRRAIVGPAFSGRLEGRLGAYRVGRHYRVTVESAKQFADARGPIWRPFWRAAGWTAGGGLAAMHRLPKGLTATSSGSDV